MVLILFACGTHLPKSIRNYQLQKIKFPAADFYCCDKTSYGFGFDSKTKDYKLVRLVGFNFEHGCEVKVYTSGTNTWKSLNYIPYRLSYGRTPAVLVNGALHWITMLIVPEDKSVSGSDEDPRLILSFDISNESFQEVPKPDMLNDKFRNNVDVLDGYLCLLSNNYKVHVDMWVMKDYGVRESWTKLFTISRQSFIRAFDYVKPILSFKNGKGFVGCGWWCFGFI
ncbi:F-box protein CPR1-like [Papaver somniferum]|uniref:F-box protein CPR1-like n=1 Tax=Papaver somniferum TaxID=3469 RepID=UPI000E6FF095|nr:F-box protein CPR1-like [Papaver somniferum]